MRTLMLFLALPEFGLPGAALAQPQAVKDPLVGCYSLEIGPWDPPLHPGNAPSQIPPERIHLSDETGQGPLDRWRTIVRPVLPYGDTPSAYWERAGSDSVQVIWTNGFSGVQLHLRIGSDSLHGTARMSSDKLGGLPDPQAEVVARRTPCGENPHVRARQPSTPPGQPRAAGDCGPAIVSASGA